MEETGARLLSDDEYLLDASALRLLPRIASGLSESTPTLLVSDILDHVLAETHTSVYLELIADLVNARGADSLHLAREIRDAYVFLRAKGQIVLLSELKEQEVCGERDLAPGVPEFEVASAGGKSTQLAAANANAILAYSAGKGTAVLMRNRALARALRGRVTVIELADRVESLMAKKQELTTRLFGKRHTKTVKFFVGAVITVGGFWYAPLGFAGAAFALLDP